jgi:hypothetical protein
MNWGGSCRFCGGRGCLACGAEDQMLAGHATAEAVRRRSEREAYDFLMTLLNPDCENPLEGKEKPTRDAHALAMACIEFGKQTVRQEREAEQMIDSATRWEFVEFAHAE